MIGKGNLTLSTPMKEASALNWINVRDPLKGGYRGIIGVL